MVLWRFKYEFEKMTRHPQSVEAPEQFAKPCQSLQQKHQEDVNAISPVSFLLTLTRFHILFWAFRC